MQNILKDKEDEFQPYFLLRQGEGAKWLMAEKKLFFNQDQGEIIN